MEIITGIRKSSDNSRIEYVRVYGHPYLRSRQMVINWIKNGAVVKSQNALGPLVVVVLINGMEYIKTMPDRTTNDNLGRLPIV